VWLGTQLDNRSAVVSAAALLIDLVMVAMLVFGIALYIAESSDDSSAQCIPSFRRFQLAVWVVHPCLMVLFVQLWAKAQRDPLEPCPCQACNRCLRAFNMGELCICYCSLPHDDSDGEGGSRRVTSTAPPPAFPSAASAYSAPPLPPPAQPLLYQPPKV
jgi:hypothetical protein